MKEIFIFSTFTNDFQKNIVYSHIFHFRQELLHHDEIKTYRDLFIGLHIVHH